MATAIDDNDADGQLDKSIWRLLDFRCTNMSSIKQFGLTELFRARDASCTKGKKMGKIKNRRLELQGIVNES